MPNLYFWAFALQKHLLKAITLAIGLYNRPFALLAVLAVTMLHTENTFEAFLIYMFEDILVVYLTGSRFIPSWIVTHLKIANLVPRQIDVGNKVALGNLLMIQVVEDFAGLAVHRTANLVGLRDSGQK